MALGAEPTAGLDPAARALATQAAVSAIKSQAASIISKTELLGPVSNTILQKSAGIAEAFIEGGNEAVWDALTSTLAIGAGEACAETGAGLAVAPLCGYIGQKLGEAIKYTFADPPEGPPTLLQTHNERYYSVYNVLLAQVPDDRKAKLSKFNSVYDRASAQLAVICYLWTDGVSFAATGGVSGTLGLYAGTIKDKGMTDYAPPDAAGGVPHASLLYGPGEAEGWADAWPMLTSADAEWAWVCTTFSWAFGNLGEPLPEFRTGCQPSVETAAARAQYWDFSRNWIGKYLDHTISPAFKIAAQRILLAAHVETEWRFNNNVQALAHAIQDKLLPLCNGGTGCTMQVLVRSRQIAHDALMVARGLPLQGGTPQEIVDAGVSELLSGPILLAESGVLEQAEADRAFVERQKAKKAAEGKAKAHKKAVARGKKKGGTSKGKSTEEAAPEAAKPGGVTLGRVVLGATVAVGVGALGLGAARAATGLSVVPKSWKPQRWLK